MNRSHLILLFILSTFIFNACRQSNKTANVVFILVDDLGWKDLGCYGSEFYETKHIDRLANEGVRFTNAYAACPVCSPTRAAIMTGKYPSRVNITDWIPGDDPRNRKLTGTIDNNELALHETTLAEALNEEGYKTFFAGKWHLGDEGYFPEDQGFDINIGGHHRGSPPGGYYVPYKNPKLADGPEGEYLTDRLTTESINFIRENKDSAFFLYLSFYTVHTPIQSNKEHEPYYQYKLEEMGNPVQEKINECNAFTTITQYNTAYASMVHAMDQNIGRLMQALEEVGIMDNTLVILTSDNGGLSTITYPGWTPPTSIQPLRAGKGWCYEGGIRVPLIIKAPGLEAAEQTAPVISMDLYPTILELAGLQSRPTQHIDGISLKDLLYKNKLLDRKEIFWHYPHYHSSGWTPGAAIRSEQWKLIEFYELAETELYDLDNDPGETSNLAEEYPDIVKELLSKLHTLQDGTAAKYPENNPTSNIQRPQPKN